MPNASAPRLKNANMAVIYTDSAIWLLFGLRGDCQLVSRAQLPVKQFF